MIVGNQRHADFGDAGGLQVWRDMVITTAKSAGGRGGCPLGSLGGQLAESDPQARVLIAAGFEQWSAAISDGLRALHAAGHLRADLDPDDFAVTLLAAVQGGLLLAQVQRDTRPLETAVPHGPRSGYGQGLSKRRLTCEDIFVPDLLAP